MRFFKSAGDPDGGSAASDSNASLPTSCPTCKSGAITTTAKSPDAASYWRCTKCGDVWNDVRRQGALRQGSLGGRYRQW